MSSIQGFGILFFSVPKSIRFDTSFVPYIFKIKSLSQSLSGPRAITTHSLTISPPVNQSENFLLAKSQKEDVFAIYRALQS